MMLSSGSTQETGAVEQNPLSRDVENDESFSPRSNSDPLMDDTENKSVMTEKADPMTAPEENGPEQSPEPEGRITKHQTSQVQRLKRITVLK